MIRFILSLLLVHASLFAIISCTSHETTDDLSAIEDDGGASASVSDKSTAANSASANSGDNLESELDNSSPTENAANADDQALEKELSDQDLESGPSDKDQAQADNQSTEQAPDDSAVEPDNSSTAQEVPPTEPPPAPPAEAPVAPKEEKAKIQDIRYVANSSGGTVVIEASKPITFQTRTNAATHQFIIEIPNAELPGSLQRPYMMKDFNSQFGSINAYQNPGSDTARVVIQMNGDATQEPIVQQEGASLVVIPPTPAPVASAPQKVAPKPPAEPQTLAAKNLDEFLTGNQKFYGRRINIQYKDADVRDAINFIAEQSGANIVMSDEVKGNISLKLRHVPWDQALVTIMRAKGLGYVRQGNVLRISSLKRLQSEAEATNKILEAQKKIVPDLVQVIPISYAALKELEKSVTPFLTPKEGKVVVDKRTSTLIVTDKPDIVARIEKLVKTLDVPPAQVSIESKIVEAVEGFENFVGVNWGTSGSSVQLSPSAGAYGAPITLTPFLKSNSLSSDFIAGAPFSAGISVGTLDAFGNLTASLTLAEKDSLAKIISAPRISAMNREKATIEQKGENVTVITTRSEQTGAVTKTEKRTPFSLQLSVTPQITSDGSVIMALDVKREFLGAVVDPETGARPVNSRSAQTSVMVRNGQTAVIGGIYTSDELQSNTGIPGLKDIPVIGWLFKSRSYERSKNELLIFMTPRILSRSGLGPETASN